VLCNDASEALKICAAVEALALNPPGRLHAWMMLSGVICDRQQLKVLQSVVVLDSVSVVDVLPGFELSSKVRRHDVTMLKLI
jgi:hypothetical protein